MNILLIVIPIVVLVSGIQSVKILGVIPERLSLYDESKPFTCLDNSNTIPFDQVNDDYCDCRDGSDEPGTAACLNGVFACENLGYIVQTIPSSRVNDNMCDCCDGTDEKAGKCENTCAVLAAKMKEEEEKLKLIRDQGSIKRKELIERGAELKKLIRSKLEELEAKKVEMEAAKVTLEEKKNKAEELAKVAKENEDKIHEQLVNENRKRMLVEKAQIMFELLDANKDSMLKPDELLVYQELDILFDNDQKFTLEEAIKLLDNLEQVGFDLFAEVYYDKLAPHIKTEETKQQEETHEKTLPKEGESESIKQPDEFDQQNEENAYDEQADLDEDYQNIGDDQVNEEDDEAKYNAPAANVNTNERMYTLETQTLIDESKNSRQLFDTANRELSDVQREIDDAKKKLSLDMGVHDEFAGLVDSCFDFDDREYVYVFCPFVKTIQRSKSNQGETLIGNYQGWNDDSPYSSSHSLKYSVMKFTNGLTCWNGPQRSTNVLFSCGIDNRLVSVSEPNKCEYEMQFETPAMCEESNASQDQAYAHEDL